MFRALQAAANGFVVKESAGRELIDAVHAGHRYLSQKISDQLIEDYLKRREATTEEALLDELTVRERQILKHLVEADTAAEIAEAPSLSRTTVNTYRSRLMKKLDISDLPSLVKFAIRHELTDVE